MRCVQGVLGPVGQVGEMRVGSPRDRASWYEVRFIRSTKPISGVISHGLDELCYAADTVEAYWRPRDTA